MWCCMHTIHWLSNVILSAVQKNLGLLALIDEESRFPRASDQSLATKLHNTHSNNTSGAYLAPPDGGTTFGISHYAGHVSANFLSTAVCSTWLLSITILQVQYDMTGFLDKNRDTLPPSIIFLMKGETVTVNLARCYEVWSAGLQMSGTWWDLWTVTLQMLMPLKRLLTVVP